MNLTSSIQSVIINSKIGLLRDNVDCRINDLELWLNRIINQSKKESTIRTQRCEICNAKEIFEGHHIAGRKHDHRQITSCKSCHKQLSDKQKMWDKRWEKENLSDDLKLAFFLLGLHDILILKSERTVISLYENLGSALAETISELLKRG